MITLYAPWVPIFPHAWICYFSVNTTQPQQSCAWILYFQIKIFELKHNSLKLWIKASVKVSNLVHITFIHDNINIQLILFFQICSHFHYDTDGYISWEIYFHLFSSESERSLHSFKCKESHDCVRCYIYFIWRTVVLHHKCERIVISICILYNDVWFCSFVQ